MSDNHIIREIDHPARNVRGVELFVRQVVWDDGVNGYSVINAGDEELLNDEDFDHMPSDAEIAAQPDFKYWRLTAAHAFHDLPEIGCSGCEAIDPGTWRERYSDLMNEDTP